MVVPEPDAAVKSRARSAAAAAGRRLKRALRSFKLSGCLPGLSKRIIRFDFDRVRFNCHKHDGIQGVFLRKNAYRFKSRNLERISKRT